MKDYSVYVINGYTERAEKYKSDKRYILHKAIHWEDVPLEKTHEYHFYYNCKVERRKKIVACTESHKQVIQKIIDENLKDVIILEDDALLDFDNLHRLEEADDFTYIGGDINALKVKDFKTFDKEKARKSLTTGINKIDNKKYRIGWGCGYYIPNKDVAQNILENMPHGKKHRIIDVEFFQLQKKEIIKDFLYPAIVTLHMGDALNGFNGADYSSHYKHGENNLY